jgi:tetratricopeptide (TPR) repeat protein
MGALQIDQGSLDEANSYLLAGLSNLEPAEAWVRGWGLHLKGRMLCEQANFDRALTELEESLTISRALGDGWLVATSLNWLGRVRLKMGDYNAAQGYWDQSKQLFKALQHQLGVAYVLYGEGEAALQQRLYQKTRQISEERLKIEEGHNNPRGIASAKCWLGRVSLAEYHDEQAKASPNKSLAEYHYEQAKTYLNESFARYEQLNDLRGIAETRQIQAQLGL